MCRRPLSFFRQAHTSIIANKMKSSTSAPADLANYDTRTTLPTIVKENMPKQSHKIQAECYIAKHTLDILGRACDAAMCEYDSENLLALYSTLIHSYLRLISYVCFYLQLLVSYSSIHSVTKTLPFIHATLLHPLLFYILSSRAQHGPEPYPLPLQTLIHRRRCGCCTLRKYHVISYVADI